VPAVSIQRVREATGLPLKNVTVECEIAPVRVVVGVTYDHGWLVGALFGGVGSAVTMSARVEGDVVSTLPCDEGSWSS
jgi:hypothetical protein